MAARATSEDSTTYTGSLYGWLNEDNGSESCSGQADLSKSLSHCSRPTFSGWLGELESTEDLRQLHPRSLHPNFRPDYPVLDEHKQRQEVVGILTNYGSEGDHFMQTDLISFSVYRQIGHPKGFDGQLENLCTVACDSGCPYQFDGIVQCRTGNKQLIGVQLVSIRIGRLGDRKLHTVKDRIWIQSAAGSDYKYWYKFCNPSPEYQEHWHQFLWVVDFAKHMVDYLCDATQNGILVSLNSFSYNFWSKINSWHGKDQDFLDWHKCTGQQEDFRKYLVRHFKFLRYQAKSLCEESEISDIMQHPVWQTLEPGQQFIKEKCHPEKEQSVVTPNIAASFLEVFPHWGKDGHDLLEIVSATSDVYRRREMLRHDRGLPNKFSVPQAYNFSKVSVNQKVSRAALLLETAARKGQSTTIPVERLKGKAVVVRRKEVSQLAGSRKSPTFSYDFAYVDRVSKSEQEFYPSQRWSYIETDAGATSKPVQELKVIWLTLPSTTICGSADDGSFYPIGNELFFTNKCNCQPVAVHDVVAVYEFTSFAERASDAHGLFANLMYCEDDHTIRTVDLKDMYCNCKISRVKQVFAPIPTTEGRPSDFRPLQNLSLFSGCGLLDHGLERHGTMETIFAIDANDSGLSSHAANTKSRNGRHVNASVNGWLKKFLGVKETNPKIDSLVAGSPCQGYSKLNGYRDNKRAQRNCSLLATTLAWVDLFLPIYVLLENVPDMDFASPKNGIKNAAAQAICCLVAMGYQVRKFVLQASDFGGSTIRRRLFIVAAAPGHLLPDIPRPITGSKCVEEAIRGLPTIHNDTLINISHPDHVPLYRFQVDFEKFVNKRDLLHRIPKHPDELGLVDAFEKGLLTETQNEWFTSCLSEEQKARKSNTMRRVNPKLPFQTIVTCISPMDARFIGKIIHPYEDRTLSLEEVRRAQGIPDWFVLVGKLKEQLVQIGNGVAWEVAVALGKSFGEAWIQSLWNKENGVTGSSSGALMIPRPVTLQHSLSAPTRTAHTVTARTRPSDRLNRTVSDTRHEIDQLDISSSVTTNSRSTSREDTTPSRKRQRSPPTFVDQPDGDETDEECDPRPLLRTFRSDDKVRPYRRTR